MYQTPRQLSDLDAQAASQAIVFRASTSPEAGPWQYRLYTIGVDNPQAAYTERDGYLLVRVGLDGAVHEVASSQVLPHRRWAEDLFDRLWQALEEESLPIDPDGGDALTAAEQALVTDVTSGPDPRLDDDPQLWRPNPTTPPLEENAVWETAPRDAADFRPGDLIAHRSGTLPAYESAVNVPAGQEAQDVSDDLVETVVVDSTGGELLVQDVDGDEEPYPVDIARVAMRRAAGPGRAEAGVERPRFRPRSQDDLAPSGPLARIRANIAAILVLHTLREEKRPATEAEQAVLARWSSWGAAWQVFDPRKPEFAGVRGDLRSLLTEQEWYAAEATVRNAHFTDASLVQPIWQALKDLGFSEGRVLEPGCGSGNFLAFAPSEATMTGVELDPTTAEIAAALYPDTEIRGQDFKDTRLPEGYFDGVIGSVPFDEIAPTDPVHNPLRLALHNYTIVKSLELTRPGGLVAVITSRYTLDSMGRTARLEIADRADLVGAVRLPAGAHQRAAGTDVVTDILILRRRDGKAPATPPEWVGLSPVQVGAETNVLVNNYFAKHPQMVLGTIGLTSTQYGRDDLTVRPKEVADLTQTLTEALATITCQAHEMGLTMSASPDAVQRAAVEQRAERMRQAQEMFGEELQRFEGTLIDQGDGTFLQVVGGELADRPVFKNAADELRALLRLRDTYVDLLSAESTGQDAQATALRGQLNAHYDAYVAKFGFLNDREGRSDRRDRRSAHGAFRTEPYAAGVYALEVYDKDSRTAKKSAIFTRAVTKPQAEHTRAETPQDALAISLNAYGKVELGEVARLLGMESLDEARDALGEMVFNEPGSQRLVPAAEYLSGNVREKIEQAEKILRMVSEETRAEHPLQLNVTALRGVLPPDAQPGDIENVEIGATWVAPKYYEQFIRQLLQTKAVTVTRASGADWEVDAPKAVHVSRTATKVYGTVRRDAVELFFRMLRRATLVVKPPKPDENTTPEELRNGKRWAADQTEQAIAKADELNRLFADWLWQDAERTKDVLGTYNRLYNSYIPYQGDGSHLTFPGLSETITPLPHQRAGVARALSEPYGTFFDYEVGAGKTYTIAMTVMEMKRLGMMSKPSIVVKNSTINDFRNDFLKAYPRARVLAIDSSEFTKESATAYVAQIANGDWDAVILPQSLFKRIPMSGRGQAQFVADQTAEYRARIHKALTGSDQALDPALNPGGDPLIADALDAVTAVSGGRPVSKATIKKLQGDLKRHTQRVEKNLGKTTTTGISWEQTGIDFIAVDEVQDFANGEVGANNSELALPVSAQAKDLKVKLRSMFKAYGRKVGLGSTGTPFPNAMPQSYVMLDLFRPDLLQAAEISAFSSFQAQYLAETMAPEISPEGIPRIKERIGGFRNAKSFSQLWKSIADVKTKHDLNLPVPNCTSETIVVPATDADREYMAEIADRAEAVRARDVDPTQDNLLNISNDGRLAAMDLRMVGMSPDGPGKLDTAADKIAQIWQEYKDHRYADREGTPSELTGALQLVFADRGTASEEAKKRGKFIAYDYLRDELVKRGIPEDKIRYSQDARTAEAKEKLFADARAGKVAVLIGSTDTMGVGVNVQDRAIALHHLDCPWRPSDVTQREGRIIRQFNQHFTQGVPVQLYRWTKAGSFDAFMWQTVERKARFIDQVRTGRELDEQDQALDGDLGKDYLEYGEIKAIATGNPLLLKKLQADEEVRQLEAAYKSWQRTHKHLRTVVDTADETLAKAQERADLVAQALTMRADTKGGAFRTELPNGTVVTKRGEAATALRTQLVLAQRMSYGPVSRWENVATVGGQQFEARINSVHDYIEFRIRGLRDIPQATFTIDDVGALISDGKSPLGVVTRMENLCERLDEIHTRLLGAVEELKQEINRAQKLVDQPFTKLDKLHRARAEQARLDAEIESQATGQDLYEDDTAAAERPSAAEPATAGSGEKQATAEPYADRAEYWAAEHAALEGYRTWQQEFGTRLVDGTDAEVSLVAAAQLMLSQFQEARRSRLLGLEQVADWPVLQAATDLARKVAEQWDREQRGPVVMRRTWEMAYALRDHAVRYRATVEDRETTAFQQWWDGDEPITVADNEALESIPGLSIFDQYTVTGPEGVRTGPFSGVDLAAGIAQLLADGMSVEENSDGIALSGPDGARFEIKAVSPTGRPASPEIDAAVLGVRSAAENIGPAEVDIQTAAGGADQEGEPEPEPESVPAAEEVPGSGLAQAHRLAVLLDHYADGGELVAGRERVGESIRQLRDALDIAEPGDAACISEFAEASADVERGEQLSPTDVFARYDRLAAAASRLADEIGGQVAEHGARLAQRTERHLGRMHATGRDLVDMLLDASALDTDAWSVLVHNDPLKEKPAPYPASDQLTFARQLLFETYDRWPEVFTSKGGEASAQLRGAMWNIRQAPDTAIGTALIDWMQVVSYALDAAEEAENSVSRTVLRDLAQRAYRHHQALAAHQLAVADSPAYGQDRSFADGVQWITTAWEAWLRTPTARDLAERTGRAADAALGSARTALEEIRQALYGAEWATTDDGTLEEVTRRTTKLAHTTYALVLSLQDGVYRSPDDGKALTRLVRASYEHAAACRASADDPQAVADVCTALAQQQEALRAGADPQTAPEPITRPKAEAQVSTLEVEHHYRGTVVRGTTNEERDAPVRAALDRHGFRFSRNQGYWYLPRRMVQTTRDVHVRKLVDELSRLGRTYRMTEEPPEQAGPQHFVIPVGEPYASKGEATDDFEETFAGYWRMQDTPAGKRLITRGVGARPDGEAVHRALEDLRQGPIGSGRDPFADPADDVVRRCTELARATQTLARNLEEEHYRAPVALRHFRTISQYATLLASRITATAQQEGLWERLFAATRPSVEAEPASQADVQTTTEPEAQPAQTPRTGTPDALVDGPYKGEGLLDAVEHLDLLTQQVTGHLPGSPQAEQVPAEGQEAWFRGPAKVEVPDGFVPYDNDTAALKPGDVVRVRFKRWLESRRMSHRTVVITGPEEPADGYYRGRPVRTHPSSIVAIPADSRLVSGAEDDRYTLRWEFDVRWESAAEAARAAYRGEVPLTQAVDAYRQAFTATGALVRELERGWVPPAGRELLSQLLADSEQHIVRLVLTDRVAEETVQAEQRHREQQLATRQENPVAEGQHSQPDDPEPRRTKRAEVEAVIAAGNERNRQHARDLAIRVALDDDLVRARFAEPTTVEDLRAWFWEWLRQTRLNPPEDLGTDRFEDYFVGAGAREAFEVTARQVFDEVYRALNLAAQADDREGAAAQQAATSAQEQAAVDEGLAAVAESPQPPGRAGQIQQAARASGWEVAGQWARWSEHSSPHYQLTLRAQTAHGPRHYSLVWELSRGNYTYNAQRSAAHHHSGRSVVRPRLAEVEQNVLARAIEAGTSAEQAVRQILDPSAPTEQDTLFAGLAAEQPEPVERREVAAPRPPEAGGTVSGAQLTQQHLEALPHHANPRPTEDARLAVVTTLNLRDGQVRDVLMLLQSLEVDAVDGSDPIVRGAQIVPHNNLLPTSLNGRFLPADLLAMADARVLPLSAPIPWAQVEQLATLPAHEARLALPLGEPTAQPVARFATTGQLRTHFRAAPIPGDRRELERMAKHASFELTPNGQFAMVQQAGDADLDPVQGTEWCLRAAGSGVEFGRVDEYAYLLNTGLETALSVMGGLRSREDALVFSERLAALRDHLGAPIDWSNPALPRTVGGYRYELDRLVLCERALFDQERGLDAEQSEAVLVWNLMAERPDRLPAPAGQAYPDDFRVGDHLWFEGDDEYLPREVLGAQDGPAGLVTLTLAALRAGEEDGTVSAERDDVYSWDVPRNLLLARATREEIAVEAARAFGLALPASEPSAEQQSADQVPHAEEAAAHEEHQPEPDGQVPATDEPEQEESVTVTEPAAAAGSWSSRIKIVTDGGRTFVTGTGAAGYWEHEAELRDLLKKGRRFAFRDGRWRYQGRAADRDRAMEEIRAYLRTMDERATSTPAASATEYPPTEQQQKIIDAALAGRNIAVQALAGTGKTATLQMVTRRMPDKRIVYVAFNRSIADEAKRKFPRNVTADTSHAFARAALRNTPLRYKIAKAGRNGGARRPKDVAQALGLNETLRYKGGGIEPEDVARIVMSAIRRFRESADTELGTLHLGQSWALGPAAPALLEVARRAWADIADPTSNNLYFSHDDYLKQWALTNPQLNYDVILFDEAQDINPVLKKVIQDQDTQTIVVGDSNQSIYEFRGAIDALKDWPADEVLPLTQSWRFGPEVAAVGNAYLQLLNSELVLEGNPALDTTLGPVEEPDAVLTRTNIGAIASVFAGFEAGKRVALVGGGRDIEEIAKAARDLQRGRRTKHPELQAFDSWNEVREYAESEDDKSLQMFVRLVDRYSPEGLLGMIGDLVPEDAKDEAMRPELVVSTAHKAKGREWSRVRIGPDFPQPPENENGELALPAAEELRLAYVTVTRAKERLEMGSLGWVHTLGEELVPVAVQQAVAAAPERAAAQPPAVEAERAAAAVTDAADLQEQASADAAPERVRGPLVSVSLSADDQGKLTVTLETNGSRHERLVPGLAPENLPGVELPVTAQVPALVRPASAGESLVSEKEVTTWLAAHLPGSALAACWGAQQARPGLAAAMRDALRDSMAPALRDIAAWLVETAAEQERLVGAAHANDQDNFAVVFAPAADDLVIDGGSEHLIWSYLGSDGARREEVLHLAVPAAYEQLRHLKLPADAPREEPAPEQEAAPDAAPAQQGPDAEDRQRLIDGFGDRLMFGHIGSQPKPVKPETPESASSAPEATGQSSDETLAQSAQEELVGGEQPSLFADSTAAAPDAETAGAEATGGAQPEAASETVATARSAPLPWDYDKIRRRAQAGIRRGQNSIIPNLAREISEAVGASGARIVWEQDHPFDQFLLNLQHTLVGFGESDATRILVDEVAGALQQRIGQIADRAAEHYNALITPNADDPQLLAALEEQLTADNRLPELTNPFVREALVLILRTIDDAERTARSRKLKPAAVRDALDQIVGLAGSTTVDGELFPHLDAALTPVKVQLDVARELMAELGWNAPTVEEYAQLRRSIADREQQAAAAPQTDEAHQDEPSAEGEAAAPEPLADRDIAAALGRISAHDFGQLIFDLDSGQKRYPQLYEGFFQMPSGPGNEQGQETASAYSSRSGLEITVSVDDIPARAGKLPWPRAVTWLRPALTPLRRELIEMTWRTSNALQRTEDGFTAIGERGRFQAVRQEVRTLLESLRHTLISESLRAHEEGTAEGLIARNRLSAQEPDDGLISLDDLVDPASASERAADEASLERVRRLYAVLPEHHTSVKALREVQAGDAFWQVSPQRLLFVAGDLATIEEGRISIAGELLLGGGERRPYVWSGAQWTDLDVQVQPLTLPHSFGDLVDAPADAGAEIRTDSRDGARAEDGPAAPHEPVAETEAASAAGVVAEPAEVVEQQPQADAGVSEAEAAPAPARPAEAPGAAPGADQARPDDSTGARQLPYADRDSFLQEFTQLRRAYGAWAACDTGRSMLAEARELREETGVPGANEAAQIEEAWRTVSRTGLRDTDPHTIARSYRELISAATLAGRSMDERQAFASVADRRLLRTVIAQAREQAGRLEATAAQQPAAPAMAEAVTAGQQDQAETEVGESDSFAQQIAERKERFIEQVRTGGELPVTDQLPDDPDQGSEELREFEAAVTGDPLPLDELQAQAREQQSSADEQLSTEPQAEGVAGESGQQVQRDPAVAEEQEAPEADGADLAAEADRNAVADDFGFWRDVIGDDLVAGGVVYSSDEGEEGVRRREAEPNVDGLDTVVHDTQAPQAETPAAPADSYEPTAGGQPVRDTIVEEPVAQPEAAMEEPRSPATDELDQHFESIIAVLRDGGEQQGTEPVTPAAAPVTRRLSEDDERRLNARFDALRAELNRTLRGIDADPILPRSQDLAVDAADAAELDTALGAAQDQAGYYWGTPEWETIRQVRDAAQGLRAAVREAVGTYAEELVRDVRTHGLDRTIQARTARVISHAAIALARRLDRGGHRDTAVWRAVWRLHRASATRADRLTGLLPPGQRIDLVGQLRGAWQWLASRITTRPAGEEGGDREPGRMGALMERGFETVKRAYHAAADRIGDLAHHPLWRRVTAAFESAQEVMDRARLGVHRLSADNSALGTGRTLWVRTVELISHGIRTLLDRLERGDNRGGLRWNALRVLHHAAEEHISHLRGYLPEGETTPLGTYYDPEPATQNNVVDGEQVTSAAPRAQAEAQAAGQESGPLWNPEHEPFRSRWFNEVRAALPRDPRTQRELSRGDMISLLFRENQRAVRGQTDRAEAGQRANEAVELYLSGRGSEVPAMLAGEGYAYVRGEDGGRWQLRVAESPAPAARLAAAAAEASVGAEQAAATPAQPEAAEAQAPPLPQRHRGGDAPAPAPASAALQQPQQQQGEAPDQRAMTQQALAMQAQRLRDRARLAAAAATTPAERSKAEMLMQLADKSQVAAQKLSDKPQASVAPSQEKALMAEPFLAALRVHAAAKGAALPENVIQGAWQAAVKATATAAAKRPSAQPQSPAAKGPKKEKEQRPQRHTQEELHQRRPQGNAPSTPGRR
ncbi:AAA family ATPase [Streptantibioticus parmotrematis]|uniref:AAA family ATPase n=1 Tax=Streptantibioticus parmotrematis TaxID=2873249 RepID=UPI00207BF182|nr:AAA family ATPase [Streptantibioticus parmotrematis]